MENSETTLKFDHIGMEWVIDNSTWEHAVSFLTHEAAMDYINRNRIIVGES